MRIYLSARYGRRQELLEYGRELVVVGHEIVSRWLYRGDEEATFTPFEAVRQQGRGDLFDMHQAECLVAFTELPFVDIVGATRGGRHVEFGIALGRRPHIRLIVVGPRENVFHCLDQVEAFATWAQCRAALIAERVGA